jgi:phosphate transport system substrate-binding protein
MIPHTPVGLSARISASYNLPVFLQMLARALRYRLQNVQLRMPEHRGKGEKKMKNLLKITVFMMVGVLVIVTGQMANAQELRKDIMKGIVQTIGPDALKDMLKSMVLELAKDEEFRKQIIREVVGAIGPDGMKNIMKSVAGDFANSQEVKKEIVREPGGTGPDQMRAALVSIAGEFIKDPGVIKAISAGGSVTSPQALMKILREKTSVSGGIRTQENGDSTSAQRRFGHDLIAIITHPSNPIDTLTVDQVRKLFSGEYANWSQVGGADLPVQLVTSRDTPATLESLLDTHLAPSAARVPFLSFLFVGVAETEGAVGFLPTGNMEQLEFVRGHGAIKKIAIKRDDHSPALTPNPGAVIDGSYPLLARDAK